MKQHLHQVENKRYTIVHAHQTLCVEQRKWKYKIRQERSQIKCSQGKLYFYSENTKSNPPRGHGNQQGNYGKEIGWPTKPISTIAVRIMFGNMKVGQGATKEHHT